MIKNRFVLLQWAGKVLLLILVIEACNTSSSGPLLRPKFIRPKFVQPQIVESTWRFETIFSPLQFHLMGQDWLAFDSMGRPAMAYGGSQLNYAWFDGSAWQVETIDSRPGAGKSAHLLFDANDQPHIFYATGGIQNTSLDTIYRDSQGWHHQTIDPDFLYAFHFDVILDNQGDPVVAYESSPMKDNGIEASDIRIRVAYQADGKWKIAVAGEQGTSPSLTIDQQARLHLGYLYGTVFLVDAIYQPDGTWQEQSRIEVSQYANVSDLLIDADLQPHFFYCSTSEISGQWACMLYHTWLTDNGWQKEQVGPIGRVGVPSSIVMDSAGRIYLLSGEKHPILLRRDAGGWHELRTLDEESGYYPGLSLVLDRNEQVRAAYLKMPDYTIHYVAEQDGTWQNQIVDQGNEPYWASPSSSETPFAMSYDESGQLHIAHYDAQHNVHYRSESSSGWQDEVVAQIRYLTNPSTIELLFDLDAQPHIFYENIKSLASGEKHVLEHAFQANGIWISEDVPFDLNDEGDGRSLVGINLDGQPAIVETENTAVEWRYRTRVGWNTQSLGNIRASSTPRPQIAFPQREVSAATSAKRLLPDMFYFDYQEDALIYRAFSQEQYMVVPLLRQSDQLGGFAMRQIGSDTYIFLVLVYEDGRGVFRYALYQNGAWRVYELSDLYAPIISNQVIDLDGSVRLAYLDSMFREPPLYYVEGKGTSWKKTLITGYTAKPSEMILEATALSQNGEYCILFTDFRANSLNLGCLESTGK